MSKIENGKQTPSDEDIRAWASATNREAEAADLLAALHTLELQYAEWQRQLRGGLKPHQSAIAEVNARTRLFRVFESTFVPGLLQTAEYARSRFAQSLTVFKMPNDINQAVQARVQRQDVLYRPEKRFHFVLTEAVLRYRLCPPEVMLGQLDRLISMAALPNVKLGIVEFETAYVVAPAYGFWLLDDERVMVETFSAELNFTLAHLPVDDYAGLPHHGRADFAKFEQGEAMRAHFLGKDPESTEGDSPTLFATDRTDRLTYIAQGWKVTDPQVLADVGSVPDHETLIEIPEDVLKMYARRYLEDQS